MFSRYAPPPKKTSSGSKGEKGWQEIGSKKDFIALYKKVDNKFKKTNQRAIVFVEPESLNDEEIEFVGGFTTNGDRDHKCHGDGHVEWLDRGTSEFVLCPDDAKVFKASKSTEPHNYGSSAYNVRSTGLFKRRGNRYAQWVATTGAVGTYVSRFGGRKNVPLSHSVSLGSVFSSTDKMLVLSNRFELCLPTRYTLGAEAMLGPA